jgi:pimeloyl-ACP methyl ester carboxylesterase
MGGYIAYEMIRQAADRVARLALLDTGAGAEAPERRAGRLRLIALAEQEGAVRAQQELLPLLIHTDRLRDKPLVDTVLQMASDTGVAAFKRQQMAIMARPDNRPLLSTIKCPTTRRCPHAAELGAGNFRRHPRRAARDHPELRPPLHLGTAGGCQSGAAGRGLAPKATRTGQRRKPITRAAQRERRQRLRRRSSFAALSITC